jgi:hypothetical protein
MEVIFFVCRTTIESITVGSSINQPTMQYTFLLIISTPRLTMSCMPKHTSAKLV